MNQISSHPIARRVGRYLERVSKRILRGILKRFIPVRPTTTQESVTDVKSVLIVRPCFRMGNTLIATPLIQALKRRFPDAAIDYLTSDTTSSLLHGFPIRRSYTLSRRFILRPWLCLLLLRDLRSNRYDVAVESGSGSFTGNLICFLVGARYRIGISCSSDYLLNVPLDLAKQVHAYDSIERFSALLGVQCSPHPEYEVTASERQHALSTLSSSGLVEHDSTSGFVALFIGGHKNKRWPIQEWVNTAQKLAQHGGRVVVFVGPEERKFVKALRREISSVAHVIEPQPLRKFAALLAHARLLITTDSGPMHLGVALKVPVISIFQVQNSLGFRPRGDLDRILMRPHEDEVVSTAIQHPRWTEVLDDRAKTNPDLSASN